MPPRPVIVPLISIPLSPSFETVISPELDILPVFVISIPPLPVFPIFKSPLPPFTMPAIEIPSEPLFVKVISPLFEIFPLLAILIPETSSFSITISPEPKFFILPAMFTPSILSLPPTILFDTPFNPLDNEVS